MSGKSFALGLCEKWSNPCLEPVLAPELLRKLFGCQANEKVFSPPNKPCRSVMKDCSHLYRALFRLFAKMVRETSCARGIILYCFRRHQ
jgi:hypothetical protein